MLKSNKKIYLDYASSTDPNPSSVHAQGVLAKKKLENSRAKAASVLHARPKQIIFTSGGTESNNLAILGIVSRCWTPGAQVSNTWRTLKTKFMPHIVTTNIEHPSVLETCKILEARGLVELSIVPVESNGIVEPKRIKKEIKDNTVLVSVMYANNEIGTIQSIREIAKEIRHYKKVGKRSDLKNSKRFDLEGTFPLFHTDAVQASNYLDLHVERLGVDLLSLSGSKIEGSGKSGLLFVKNREMLAPVFFGGDQEMGLRPGTENVADIYKFAEALEFAQKIKNKEGKRLLALRKYFFEKLVKTSRFNLDMEIIINGDLENRLPNNINITIPNIPSDLLVIELSARGVHVSSKSACKSGDGKVSRVIQAINPNIKETDGSLRFSFGRGTTRADLDFTLKALKEILLKLKKWYY